MNSRGQAFPVLLGLFTLKLVILGCVPRLSLLYSGGLGGCAVDSVALWRAGAGSSIGRTLDALEARNGECVGQRLEPGTIIGGNHLWLWSQSAGTLSWVFGSQVPSFFGWVMGWYLGPRWPVSFLQGYFSSYWSSLCAFSSLLTVGQQAAPSVGTGCIVFCSQMIKFFF